MAINVVVEANYIGGQRVANRLKALVRKPVEFSGAGNRAFAASIGWTYKTRRGARAAAARLRRVRGVHVYTIDLCMYQEPGPH